ncbi:MAG TPA: GAF domain-containing protein [Baekduia sp.]
MGTRLHGQELEVLAGEQAALRRVATLVAHGAPPEEVFAAVTREVARHLSSDLTTLCRYEADGSACTIVGTAEDGRPVGSRSPLGGDDLATRVFATARPARIENADGTSASVGTPIILEGRPWGAIAVTGTREEPLPPDAEARLGAFAELVATAVANAARRAGLAQLADEQAALRRVATLVARGVAPEEVFATVTDEVGRLLAADLAAMGRYKPGEDFVVLATSGRARQVVVVGSRWPLGGRNLATAVFETARPVRFDDLAGATGPLAENVREHGISAAVATPIVVDGRVWGLTFAASTPERPLPPDTEARLASFTALVATAIANTESQATARRLTEEQAALRRVATLVAKEAPPEEVLARVADELATVLGGVDCSLFRDEGDGTATVVAQVGAHLSAAVGVGTRLATDGDGVIATVLREGRPYRMDDNSGATGAIVERGRVARARARHPARVAHARRPALRRHRAGVDDARAGRHRRVRGPAARGGRGDRLLRRRRGADQRLQARAGGAGRGDGARRRRHARDPRARRRHRRRPPRRRRPHRPDRPARRARRTAAGREPVRRRDRGRCRDPARRLSRA